MSIDAMKLALEALETLDCGDTYKTHNAAKALRDAIEQAEKQEPVAWHHPDCNGECIACLIESIVKTEYGTQGVDYLRRHVTPPQREWQGLTDEEKKAIYEQADIENWHDQPLLEAIETKLKEKNT